jgi:hypothetical protein
LEVEGEVVEVLGTVGDFEVVVGVELCDRVRLGIRLTAGEVRTEDVTGRRWTGDCGGGAGSGWDPCD